jgi:hypothetical protein
MPISNKTRLAKLDGQILDLQYLYQRELDREATLPSKTLLASKGFKYRLDNLYKQRDTLRAFTRNAPSLAQTYAEELSRRNTAVDIAETAYKIAEKKYISKIEEITLSGLTPDNELDLKILRRDMGAARSLFRTKERSVSNWLAKGANPDRAINKRILTSENLGKVGRPRTKLPTHAEPPAYMREEFGDLLNAIKNHHGDNAIADAPTQNAISDEDKNEILAGLKLASTSPSESPEPVQLSTEVVTAVNYSDSFKLLNEESK